MMKPLFTIMLAAALTGGQVLADSVYTVVEDTLGYDAPYTVAKAYKFSTEKGGIDGMSLTIRAPEQSETGRDLSEYKVIVAERQVFIDALHDEYGHVTNNSLVMKGGAVNRLWGAATYARSSIAQGNSVVMSGGTVFDSVVGGYSGWYAAQANQNAVYLVGKGGKATIKGVEYTGSDSGIQINGAVQAGVSVGAASTSNSLDIYGTGISAGSIDTQSTQILNFHIADAQLTSEYAPMVTLTNAPLDLTGFLIPTDDDPTPAQALTFDALGSMEWQPGTSVTLVSDALGITIDESLLNKEYNIYSHDNPETIVGTGKIQLEQNNTVLKLTVQGVPEPTTGTLSLLALAALAARRRLR